MNTDEHRFGKTEKKSGAMWIFMIFNGGRIFFLSYPIHPLHRWLNGISGVLYE